MILLFIVEYQQNFIFNWGILFKIREVEHLKYGEFV